MSELLSRRNPVLEALRAKRRGNKKLWLQKGLPAKQTKQLAHLARKQGLKIEEAPKGKISQLVGAGDHQGVVLETSAYPYVEVDEMIVAAQDSGEPALILILDLVQGMYNVGTLLRSAEACGVHGVIMQERRAPDVTPAVVQHAQGATEHLLIAKVTNLVQAINQLKEADIWIAGLDMDGELWGEVDLNRPLALVVGHEGDGLRRLTRQACDFIVQLPMRGKVESLNAGVAGSVMLYGAWQARGFK